MKHTQPDLSDRDLKAIRRSLGRNPSNLETAIMSHLWARFRREHPYRSIFSNLHMEFSGGLPADDLELSGRWTAAVIFSGAHSIPAAAAGIVKAWLQSCLNGILPGTALLQTVAGGHDLSTVNSLQSELGGLLEQLPIPTVKTLPVLTRSGAETWLHFLQAGFAPAGAVQQLPDSDDLRLLLIASAGRPPDLVRQYHRLQPVVQELRQRPWVRWLALADDEGLVFSLRDCLKSLARGLRLQELSADELPVLLFAAPDGALVTVIQGGFEMELREILAPQKLVFREIGIVTRNHNLSVATPDRELANLPQGLFDPDPGLLVLPEPTPLKSNAAHSDFDPASLPEPESYTRVLTTLLSDPVLRTDIREGSSVTLVPGPDSEQRLSLGINQNTPLVELAPRTGAAITVAQLGRDLAVCGSSLELVLGNITVSRESGGEQIWFTNQVAMGISDACRALHYPAPKIQMSFHSGAGIAGPVIAMAGKIAATIQPLTPEFKEDGDFISMLGSLRGEFGGSQYLRRFHPGKTGPCPAVDLHLEARLQEAVRLGIEGQLLKSAFNVGRGGLAVAIARCLLSSGSGLGARIHLSRKLRQGEIMFGETQGILLITISEDDLMEFERICMSVEIPSTTIGRVTGDGRLRFNDLISVTVAELRSAAGQEEEAR